MRKFSLLCKHEIKLKYLPAKCNSLLCKNPDIYGGRGFCLRFMYIVRLILKRNLTKNRKIFWDLISRQLKYSVSEKISKKTGNTRHFISRHLHFLRSQKMVHFSPKMPKSASSTVENCVLGLGSSSLPVNIRYRCF